MNFSFRLPEAVYVGKEALDNLKSEIKGYKKVFLVTDKGVKGAGLLDKVVAHLDEAGISYELFDEVEAEPSVDNLNVAVERMKTTGCDLIIGVGGGSPMDIGKGCAVMAKNPGSIFDYVGINLIPNQGIPLILIPTTAGTGSEVTQNAIYADHKANTKKGVVSPYLLPKVAIVDPEMLLSCPPHVAAATGMDALTHAIESCTSPKANVHTRIYAFKAIELITANLRSVVAKSDNYDAQTAMAYGSFFAGVSLANAGVGGVHALAYPLGGAFRVPHGVANALLLPYVMEFNLIADLDTFAEMARCMGQSIDGKSKREAALLALDAVCTLSCDIGIPQKMSELGIKESDIEGLTQSASNQTRLLGQNPRKMKLSDIENIYRKAL